MGNRALEIDQLWMHIGTLYPQRNRPAANFAAITDYFWAKCNDRPPP
jgi:hypothetical protein